MSVSANVDPVDASTLIGVLIGAAAATVGSIAAVSFERYLSRRSAERDTALVFGELLHTLCRYLDLLRAAHARGDPFGPITIRMLRAVRREVDIWDRNRERLPFVGDAILRLKVSSLMGQATFAIDRMLDATEELSAETSTARRTELMEARAQAFAFLMETAGELPAQVRRLAALAHVTFADFDAIDGVIPAGAAFGAGSTPI